MNAAQRLEAILNYYGINAKSLSEKCGYGRPQGIYDVQNGKTKEISTTMANKILSVFPELNRVWLLTGEGNMINERNNSSIIDSNNNNRGIIQNSHGNINNGNISISLPEKGTQKIIDPDGTVTIENTSSSVQNNLNEIDMLNQRIQYLERIVSGHEATIKSLETTIKSKDDLICILRSSLDKQD